MFILFISLKSLANEDTVAGELARYLLGRIDSPGSEAVKTISDTFNSSFDKLKDDKEAKIYMTLREKYVAEGRVEGREEGREEGMEKGILTVALEMHQDGFSFEQIAKYAKLPIERLREYLALAEA